MSKRRSRYKNCNLTNSGHGGGFGEIIGIAALGLGAYFLYEWLATPSISTVPVATVPVSSPVPVNTSSNITTIATTPVSNQIPATPTTNVIPVNPNLNPNAALATLLINSANNEYAANIQDQGGSDPLMTVDEWDYTLSHLPGGYLPVSATQAAAIVNLLGANAGSGPTALLMDANTYLAAYQQVMASGLSGLGEDDLAPMVSNRPSFQNAPYGVGHPGRPYSEGFGGFGGLGRTYLNGYQGLWKNNFGIPGLSGGLGIIGAGYNVNETVYGDAQAYELAAKYIM